jgi:hypothetical protein
MDRADLNPACRARSLKLLKRIKLMSEDIACTYRVTVLFDETEDGSVTHHIVADPSIGRNPDMNIMFYMAEIGVPLAGLAAQALYELLDSGLIQHTLAQARSVQRGVEVLLPNAPVDPELEEIFPRSRTLSIN